MLELAEGTFGDRADRQGTTLARMEAAVRHWIERDGLTIEEAVARWEQEDTADD